MLVARLIVWLAAFGATAWLLPWWAAAIVGAVGPAIAFRPWRGSMNEGIARSRGFPLREAFVQIDELDQTGLDGGAHQIRLELLVRPRPGNARLRPWWPGEFRFAPNVGREVQPASYEVRAGEKWSSRLDSVTGEQRLRFSLEVPAATKRLTIRYFREELAHIEVGNDAPVAGKLPVE